MITSARIYLTDCTDPHRNLAMEEAMLHSLPEGQAAIDGMTGFFKKHMV